MSGRRAKPTLPPEQLTIVWQSVSLILDYPDEAVLARAELVVAGDQVRVGGLRGGLDLLDLARPPHFCVEAHEDRDRNREADREDAPRAILQRVHDREAEQEAAYASPQRGIFGSG